METREIFSVYERKFKDLPFVRITNRTKESIAIEISSKNDRGTMRLYALFPGIFLGFTELSTSYFPSFEGKCADGIKITFCIDGRCEAKMSDSRYLLLESGDLSIDTRTVLDTYTFPYNRFQGIELCIYGSSVEQSIPEIFKASGIDIEYIRKRYCHDEQSFIAKASDKIKSIFLNIAKPLPQYEMNYYRLQVTELLFLLMYMEKPAKHESQSFFTTGQVNIAKQVMKIITRDLSVHHLINKLAKDFCVSPSSLKNYFYGVYGQSISAYLRGKRMDKAVEYLEESSLPIADIAMSIGYENASKFSAAFKLVKGESPLEYRRRHRASL
ncbi:MAG: AraC family transcriptional regulator [Treponema sp.]|jgi:AraC-like DNA-binding protein|nr:AraC family transcriptional regulator [Treponema sp.]